MAILGVSHRTIKLLTESKWHIVSLQQLVERTAEELLHIEELGQTGYREITRALQRYHELEVLKTSRIQRVREG
jgi:DNA-directed RNA polymerase alpha subunit